MLYICDFFESQMPVVHISFLLRRVGGHIKLPANQLEQNPISDVKFVKIKELEKCGFSQRFAEIVSDGFPNAESYVGLKSNIGL